ncbi:MAG: hypothetical protein JWM31_3243, partial [Solirubrobacterales bacterium]|nr:hypothetical protein [Solirubrobacterales bacterium]
EAIRRAVACVDRDLDDSPARRCWRDDHTAGAVLACFPRLRLRDDRRLVTYHWREGGNGDGWTFSFPEDAAVPSAAAFFAADDWPDRAPDEADPDANAAARGNGTLAAYVEAAVATYELREVGARWHGVSWGTHEVVDPAGAGDSAVGPWSPDATESGGWAWIDEPPASFTPEAVRDGAGLTHARFWTLTGLGGWQLVAHRLTFPAAGVLLPIGHEQRTIATGGGGYVF